MLQILPSSISIDNLSVPVSRDRLVYKGSEFEAIVLDFSEVLPAPIWGTDHISLTKAFATKNELVDLFDFHFFSDIPDPRMPLSTLDAMSIITNHFCSAPKAIRRYKFYFCSHPRRPELDYRIEQKARSICHTIIAHCKNLDESPAI